MTNSQGIVRIEQVGVILSLVLLIFGVAELTEAVDFFPVSLYILLLWILAVLLWLYRRQHP